MPPCERWEPFPNVRMNAPPLNREDKRCTTCIVRLEGHWDHRHIQTPQANLLSSAAKSTWPPSLPGRDACTGHSNWEGLGGSPGVMPITPRSNAHGDFTSFRNQILHFSPTTPFVCLAKMEQNERNCKLLYILICTTKRREQVTTLPNCNCSHPPLETWYLSCLCEKIVMISCFVLLHLC